MLNQHYYHILRDTVNISFISQKKYVDKLVRVKEKRQSSQSYLLAGDSQCDVVVRISCICICFIPGGIPSFELYYITTC